VGLCDIPPVSHLNGSWLASSLKQMPMWTELSPPSYRHLKPISPTPGYGPWYLSRTIVYMYMEEWCVAPTRAVESVHKSSDSDSSIFKTPTPTPS
jgi:hypothetical protein